MKILLCPDKFKGSISALNVCKALSQGISSVNNDFKIINHPMADGGDGSLEVIKAILSLREVNVPSLDPLGRKIKTMYYCSEEVAFIELASASGISLLNKSELNPLLTSTYGTGLLIKDALDKGFKQIKLFIGGSATTDAGIGIANALGYDFYDENAHLLDPIGGNLANVSMIKNNSPYNWDNVKIEVMCDVTNIMYGPSGAAFIYGPQKGASQEAVVHLDRGLKNYAALLQKMLKLSEPNTPGLGAAGAVGASLVGLMHAELVNGFQMLAEVTQLEKAIQESDFIITGEGKIDHTSFEGKVVGNLIQLCKKHNKPIGLICGIFDKNHERDSEYVFKKSIMAYANSQDDAIAHADKYLDEMGKELVEYLQAHSH